MTAMDMREMEASAYRDSFADGLLDLFFGASLIWMGACWLWIEPFAALAPIVPAALVPVAILVRRRLVEPRIGYVRWTAARRTWEQRELRGLFVVGAGLLFLCAGIAAVRVVNGMQLDASTAVAALPIGLVALAVLLLGVATRLRRLWAYLLVLLAAAVGTVALELDPGPGLLLSGAVVVVGGVVLAARFLRAHPGGGAA